MNKQTIRQELRRLKISVDYRFVYVRNIGPAVYIPSNSFVSPLPIDDNDDILFSEFVFKSSTKTKQEIINQSAGIIPHGALNAQPA